MNRISYDEAVSELSAMFDNIDIDIIVDLLKNNRI